MIKTAIIKTASFSVWFNRIRLKLQCAQSSSFIRNLVNTMRTPFVYSEGTFVSLRNCVRARSVHCNCICVIHIHCVCINVFTRFWLNERCSKAYFSKIWKRLSKFFVVFEVPKGKSAPINHPFRGQLWLTMVLSFVVPYWNQKHCSMKRDSIELNIVVALMLWLYLYISTWAYMFKQNYTARQPDNQRVD